MNDYSSVIIYPRDGITAKEIADFLIERFQQPGMHDDGSNPLVNATILLAEPVDGTTR